MQHSTGDMGNQQQAATCIGVDAAVALGIMGGMPGGRNRFWEHLGAVDSVAWMAAGRPRQEAAAAAAWAAAEAAPAAGGRFHVPQSSSSSSTPALANALANALCGRAGAGGGGGRDGRAGAVPASPLPPRTPPSAAGGGGLPTCSSPLLEMQSCAARIRRRMINLVGSVLHVPRPL